MASASAAFSETRGDLAYRDCDYSRGNRIRLSLRGGGFRAEKREQESRPSCSFVVLSEAEERVALAAARTSWQVGAKGVRGLRTDISSGELPPEPIRLVMPTRPKRDEVFAPVEYTPNALPPSVAAPSPAVIAPEAAAEQKKAFSREELLKID